VSTYQRVVCSNSSYLDRQSNKNIKKLKKFLQNLLILLMKFTELTKSKLWNPDEEKQKQKFFFFCI